MSNSHNQNFRFLVNRGPRYWSLNLDRNGLTYADRTTLSKLLYVLLFSHCYEVISWTDWPTKCACNVMSSSPLIIYNTRFRFILSYTSLNIQMHDATCYVASKITQLGLITSLLDQATWSCFFALHATFSTICCMMTKLYCQWYNARSGNPLTTGNLLISIHQ